MTLSIKELKAKVDSSEIDTVIVADTDMQGRLFGKRLTARYFLQSATEGISTCSVVLGWGQDHSLDPGYSFTGWETGFPDFISVPDLGSMKLCAWHPKTALVLCDARYASGAPVSISPRAILKRQLAKCAERGFNPYFASELEFYLLRETADTAHEKGFVNLCPRHRAMHPETVIRTSEDEDFCYKLRSALEASGVAIELVKAEYSPGQVEMNLEYTTALEAADRHILFKTATKEIASSMGLAATFMAKWNHEFGGSSCHTHMSMVDRDGKSIFDDGAGGESKALKHFLAGLLKYGADFFLFFAPTTNSYKRLIPNTFAPSRLSWGRDNRTVALRIIGKGKAKRIENRVPGADVNPYLVYSAMLAAGLRGIDEELQPEIQPLEGNGYSQDLGAQMPASIEAAALTLSQSAAVRSTLGEDVQMHYANFGRQTAAAMSRRVTDVERRMLLLDI